MPKEVAFRVKFCPAFNIRCKNQGVTSLVKMSVKKYVYILPICSQPISETSYWQYGSRVHSLELITDYGHQNHDTQVALLRRSNN